MRWQIDISNVGGIREGRATLRSGVNAVRGTNSRGKSSFLAAIETAMGTKAPLTEGEDEGRVALKTDDETILVELDREDGTVVSRGDSYLTDETTIESADLYAFLDERNEVRGAVRNGGDLETVLTRPLDLENIDARIAELKRERSQIDSELDRVTAAAERLPSVEERLQRLESKLSELIDRRDVIADEDTGRIAERREKLADLRAERDRVTDQITRLERSVDRTGETLEERRDELDSLGVPDDPDVDERLETHRDRVASVERDVELLQSVYAANRRVLDEDRIALLSDIDRGLVDDELTCWLCGASTDREQLETYLDALAERIADRRTEVAERREKLEAIEERGDEIRRRRRRRRELVETIADLEDTLSNRQDSLASARDRLESLERRIADRSEAIESDGDQLAELEGDIRYTRSELEDARERRSALDERAKRRSQLEDERETLADEIQQLRERRETVRRRARDAFQEAASAISARFDTSFETARLTANFELVVARDGKEASLDALSEGELELLSIIAALAGHEAYDVAEDVPILLVDRLGGIADDNLRTLVEYLSDRADILVFTTFPENAVVADNEISPDDWDVVTDS